MTGCAGERPLVPRLQASLVSLFLSMTANQGNTEERQRARLLFFTYILETMKQSSLSLLSWISLDFIFFNFLIYLF